MEHRCSAGSRATGQDPRRRCRVPAALVRQKERANGPLDWVGSYLRLASGKRPRRLDRDPSPRLLELQPAPLSSSARSPSPQSFLGLLSVLGPCSSGAHSRWMSEGASTSMEAHLQSRSAGSRDKRLRSWDVDVSLDELVEWDALEQFMSDMPGDHASGRPASGVSRHGSTDLSLSALGARGGLGPMGCGGVPRSVSNDSVGAALGLSGHPGGGLVPGAWPMMSQLGGFGAGLGGAHGGLGGAAHGLGACGLPQAASGNAAALAQSLYASWTQPAAFPLQALPMERGVSWGAELLPFMDVGDAAGLADPSALGRESPTSSETQQAHPIGSGGGGSAGAGGDEAAGGRSVQKQRFVWTSELHRRFEAAVNTLGVDQAKPQVSESPGAEPFPTQLRPRQRLTGARNDCWPCVRRQFLS